ARAAWPPCTASRSSSRATCGRSTVPAWTDGLAPPSPRQGGASPGASRDPGTGPPERRCIGSSIMAEGPITKTLASTVVYRNPWMTVREDRVERPDGSRGIYGVVDKPDFALII